MNKNQLNITNLQKAELTVGDLTNIVVVLDTLAAMFVLPVVATDALDRLRKLIEKGTRS